jgi:hypothetical protein
MKDLTPIKSGQARADLPAALQMGHEVRDARRAG